jgi:hypothetical protein
MTEVHVNYPHHPGRLYDCPACEAQCNCTPGYPDDGTTECIWAGHPVKQPTDVPCTACSARPGQPCTVPTDTGRRDVTWVHHARSDLAEGW